jgi:hypothetical protein
MLYIGMDFIYVLINGSEWEDMIIVLSKEEAIQKSIEHPNARVEMFYKNSKMEYIPTYHYYKNGEYHQNTK